jgi:hypothetical protein
MIVDQKKTEWLSGITKSYQSFITPSHESKAPNINKQLKTNQ